MNKRALREAFVKHSGRYDLVGSKTVDGERMPDYDVDDGADYYVDAAVKLLSKEVLSTRNIRHFIKTATAAFPGACIENITHVDQVAVGGTPLGMALEADLMLSMSNETLTGTPTHWAECRDITFTSEEEEEEDPEIEWIDITTIEQLQLIGNDPAYPLDGYYMLANDIDASDTATWNAGAGFEPIGSYLEPFTGTLDGQGFGVTDLYINRPAEQYVGLFSANSGTVTGCYATGAVTGGLFVGGLVGLNSGSIENCYTACAVTGEGTVGGLVGESSGPVTNCYATGAVTGSLFVGGLVGYNNIGTVTNCYATGAVTGSLFVGGLVGSNIGTVTNCYATGAVTGEGIVGGLVGENVGTVTASYYDSETSGQSDTGKGTPKTTAEMKSQTTFVGWDFDDVWSIDVGVSYPILRFVEEKQEEEAEGTETTTILLYPFPITDTNMYVSCWVYDPLVEETDENWWSINYPEAIIDLAHAKLRSSELDANKRTLESEVERIKIAVYKQDVRDEVRHLGSFIK